MTIQLLEHVSDRLRSAELVLNEREFCELWLAKSECYMRTLRFNGMEASAEALATLGSKLGYYANELARRHDDTGGIGATCQRALAKGLRTMICAAQNLVVNYLPNQAGDLATLGNGLGSLLCV